MTFPRVRLAVSACLFLAWIGFLFYLVVRSPSTIVSAPQFLSAPLWVVADLRSDKGKPDPSVTVEEVIWPENQTAEDGQGLVGKTISLPDLPSYRKPQGFFGPGKYLLPLLRIHAGPEIEYLVAAIPSHKSFASQKALLGTVELFDWGPHPEKVVKMLREDGSFEKAELDAKLERAKKGWGQPIVLARRWPAKDAEELRGKLKATGASASVIEEDVRIYPLTAETRARVMELREAKR